MAGTFRHHTINGERHLLFNLRHTEFRQARITATRFIQPGMGCADRLLAAFDCDIHDQPSAIVTLRGRAAMLSPAQSSTSTPRGNSVWLRAQAAVKSAGAPSTRRRCSC